MKVLTWQPLLKKAQLEAIEQASYQRPCLIFKHSTRCQKSSMALYVLETNWVFEPDELTPYFVDVLRDRDCSLAVAEHFAVYHESPQVLLIRNGDCIYEASGLEINVEELQEMLTSKSVW